MKEYNNAVTYIILQSKRTRKTLSKRLKPVSDMHLSLSSIMLLEREPGNQRTTPPFNSNIADDLTIPSLNLL